MSEGGWFDDVAAGDEVRDVNQTLRHMSEQLEQIGGGPAAKPLGHIAVPKDDPFMALPAGEITIDFRNGTVKHPELGDFITDLTTVEDISSQFAGASVQLENLIFHADTSAQVRIETGGQYVPLDYVPLPSETFDRIQLELQYPGHALVLASTQRLPIGIGAINLFGSRLGSLDTATTGDDPSTATPVPLSPPSLYQEDVNDGGTGNAFGDSTLWAAAYDSTTFTIDNVGANQIEARIEAKESEAAASSWREIDSLTINAGNHSIANIWQERHHYLRVTIQNTDGAAGTDVAADVEVFEGSP